MVVASWTATATAATITWDAGSATNLEWGTTANWSDDINGVTGADDAVFPGTIPNPGSLANPGTIIVANGSAANSLDIGAAYTLTGGDLTLSAGQDANSGKITVASGITGVIASTLYGGPIVKEGAGILDLTGANGFSGLTINAGVIRAGHDSALGTNDVTVSAAATIASTSATLRSFANNLVLNDNTTFGQTAGGTGALTFSGSVDLGGGAPRTLTINAATTLSGSINNGALTKAGTGMLILGGSNGYTGATIVSAGALQITNADALSGTSGVTVADAAALELSGGITVNKPLTITGQGGTNGALRSASGANIWSGDIVLGADGTRIGTGATGASITVSGAISSGANNYGLGIRGFDANSIVTLSGANTYLGGTAVVVGTLKLAGGDNRLPVASVLTIGNGSNVAGATFDVNGVNQTIGGLVASGNSMAKVVTNSGTASILTINVGGTSSYSFNQPGGTISGALSLVKNGTGTQIITEANSYTGSTTVNAGTMEFGRASALPGFNAAGRVVVTGGTLAVRAGSATEWSAADIATLVSTNAFAAGSNLGLNINSADFTLNSVISGSQGLIKTGTRAFTISSANTYAGGTSINASGVINVGNSSAFGTGAITIGSNGVRVILGNGVNVANDLVMATVDPSAGNGVIEGPATGSATYSGKITINDNAENGGHFQGRGGLIIAGPIIQGAGSPRVAIRTGTVTLNNATGNDYTTLEISGGTTTVGVANAIDTKATVNLATVAAETATLNLNDVNQAIAGLNLGSGTALINTGTGTLTLNGALAITGNNTGVISGNLSLGGATRTFTIADGTATPDLRVAAIVSNGGLTKAGTGTLDLLGANTYSDGTAVSAGTLRIGSNTALGTGAITFDAGTTLASASAVSYSLPNALNINGDITLGNASIAQGNLAFAGAVDLGGATRALTVANTATTFDGSVTNGGLTKAGAGMLTLNAANAFSGPVSVSAGTLNMNHASGLSGVTDLTVAGGAALNINTTDGANVLASSLNLGSASSRAIVSFGLGTNLDKIDLGGGSATIDAAGAVISGRAKAGFAVGNSYTVLTTGGGLSSGGGLSLGYLPPGYTYSLSNDGSIATINVTGTAPAGPYYWTGDNTTNLSWGTLGDGTDSNWATNAAGTTDPQATPNNVDVIFQASNASTTAYTTTLDGPYSISGLKFLASAPVVTIAPGNQGSLTIGANGIDVVSTANNATISTISAPVTIGANQKWSIGNTASGNNALVISGPVSGSGTLTKVGNARLEFNNQTSLLPGTNTGDIFLREGQIIARMAAMGAADGAVNSPLGTGTLHLAAGTFYLRYDGDNSGTARDYTLVNPLIIDGPTTIDLDRAGGSGGSNKNSVFPSLTINDTQLTVNQNGNGYRLAISGTITLNGQAVINAGDVTNMITGKITDNGSGITFSKVGGSTLNILGTGNDYSGGTIVAGGTLRVGSGYGTSVLNPTAVAGTGFIVVNPGARAAFNTATNIAAGQTIDIVSTSTSVGVLEVGGDFLPANLHTLTGGTLQIGSGTTPWTQSLDLSRLGDGTWRVGSSQTLGDGTLGTAAVIKVGANNVLRIGGGANTLTVNTTDLVTGTAGLDIGGPFVNGGNLGGTGNVILTSTHAYSGATVVNRGSTLRFQKGGTAGAATTLSSLGTTSGITAWGTVTAESTGTFFDSNGAVIPVTLMGGSGLKMLNAAITTAGQNLDRWGDTTPIAMNQLDMELSSRTVNAADTTLEDVGAITAANGNILRLTRSNAVSGHNLVLQADSLARTGAGTLELVRSTGTGAGFGGGQKFLLDTGAPAPVNGMTTPWIVNHTDKSHVTYGANGFTSATYVTAATLNNGTELLNTAALTLAANPVVYALKQTGAITASGSNNTVTIRGGGFIADGSATNTAKLVFNDGAAANEAMMFIDDGDTLTQSGTITANGLTKFGNGTLTLTVDNTATLTGSVFVNRGTLQLEHAGAAGARPILLTSGGTLNLRQDTGSTFNNALTIAQGQPIGTVDVRRRTTGNNLTATIPSLTLEGAASPLGQTFNLTGANNGDTNQNFDLAVSGMTTVTGNATFHLGSNTTELYLDGGITSNTANAVITKSGDQQLRVSGTGSAQAGTRFVLNGGSLTLRNTGTSDAAFNPLGAGTSVSIYVNTGTLNLRSNGVNGTFGGTSSTAGGYGVFVNGDATINADRSGSSGADKRLSIGNLTIGSNTLNLSSGNGYYIGVRGTVQINGDATFNTTAAIPEFYGAITGGKLIKNGNTVTLRLTSGDNVNDYAGGTQINGGWVYGYNTRGLGTGDIVVNPGGGLAVGKNTTLQLGQKAVLRSSAAGLAMVGMVYGTGKSALPSTLLSNVDISRAPVGVLGIGGDYTLDLDMSNLFGDTVANDGNWYLGAVAWNDTYYRSNVLLPGTGNVYRLGGGGGNVQINRNNATPNTGIPSGATADNLLNGTASVVVGLPAQNLQTHGGSEVVFGGTNSYTGGTLVNRGGTLHLASPATASQSGAGTNDIDVYGTFVLRTAGTLTNGLGGNVNNIITHPGARIFLDSNATSVGMSAVQVADRWADSVGITLNGARFDVNGRNVAGTLVEQIGTVTFERGAQLRADRNESTSRVYLKVAGLTRNAGGTLTLLQGDGLLPDQTTSDNAERIIVTGAAPTVTNGMVAPWIVDGNDHHFVTYNATTTADGHAIGFQQVAYEKTISTGTYAAASLLDTDKVAVDTLDLTLTDNPTVHALRVGRTVNNGAGNTITIRSGGLIARAPDNSTITMNPNLVFQDASSNPIEALIYTNGSSSNLRLTGTVTATQITKFGSTELQFDRATPVFNGPIQHNFGSIRVLQLNALGTGAISLAGSSNAIGSDGSGPALIFAANINSADEQTYTHGPVTSWDNNRIIYVPGGNDRSQRIGDITMESTGGAAGLSVLQFRTDANRARSSMGTLTFASENAILQVFNNNFQGGGSSTVFAPSALVGNNRKVTKLGGGMMELASLASTLSNSTLTIGAGALRVLDGASLGTSNTVVIDMGAALEIAAPSFTLAGTTTLTQNPGSSERWNVPNARGTGDYTLPQGVTLQLNTHLTSATPRTITLNGGSIEGFLYSDSLSKAVTRTVGANIAFNLASHSYIGQNTTVGLNDAGMVGQLPDSNPVTGDVRGAILVLNGPITGNFDLTKVGRDVVVLAGSNTYRNTIVEQGMLRLGKNDALPASGNLRPRFGASIDLYGYNQTVANLGVKDSELQDAVGSAGAIASSGLALANLTVTGTDDFTYNGTLGTNLNFTKGAGTGWLTLGGTTSYAGTTTVNGGGLYFGGTAPIQLTAVGGTTVADNAGIVLPFGGASRLDSAGVTSFLTNATLGNNLILGFDVADTFAYTYSSIPTKATGLIKGGSGTLVLPTASAWSRGISLRGGTTDFVAGALGTTETIQLANSNTLRWNGHNTDISGRLSALPPNSTTTFETSADTIFGTALTAGSNASVVKLGAGKLTFTGVQGYTGSTTINQGGVVFTADQTFAGSLIFGLNNGTTNAGTLETAFNLTAGELLARTNSATANTITLAADKTLTINGPLTVGYNSGSTALGAATATKLTITGGGSLVVANPTANVLVGVAQSIEQNSSSNTLDVTGLASATFGSAATPINELRVAFGQTNAGTLLLSNTANLVTANIISVGHSNGANAGNASMTLGTGTNVLNVDTFNIGLSKSNATVAFASQTAGSPGTVVIANKAGTGAANLVIGSQNGTSTSANLTGNLDLRGHTATVTADVITLGNNNNPGAGTANGVLRFDAGTLTANSMTLGIRSAAGTGSNNANAVHIGGGTFTVAGATTIATHSGTHAPTAPAIGSGVTAALNLTGGSFTTATINAAPKTGAGTGAATANINVSGGTFTVTGASFVLASQATAGSAVGNLNITGGTVSSNADITDGGGAATTTVTLNGGSLNLNGKSIGSGANLIDNVNLQAGTLMNVAEINGGAALTKTTAGLLTVDGTNTWAGDLAVTAGTVIAGKPVSLPGYNVAGKIAVDASAALALRAGGAGEFTAADIDTVLGAAGPTFAANSGFGIEVLAPNAFEYANNIGATVAAKNFTKFGAGILTLAGNNTYTGTTTVAGGVLIGATPAALPGYNSGKITAQPGATLALRVGGAGEFSNVNVDTALGSGGVIFNAGSAFGLEVLTGNTFTYPNNIGATTAAKGFVKLGAGTAELSGVNTHTGTTTVAAGTLKVTGSIAQSAGVVVNHGATFEAAPASAAPAAMNINGLTIGSAPTDAAKAKITGAAIANSILITPTLTLTGTGSQLDIEKQVLFLTYDNAPANAKADNNAAIRSLIIAGRGDGSWNGTTGITSSTILASNSATDYAVGYLDTGDVLGMTSFLGQSVNDHTLIARYTLRGDSNLDGLVDFKDLAVVAQNYNQASVWRYGDFNYDGITDFKDLASVAQHYNQAAAGDAIAGASAEFDADWALAQSIVPEPGTISLLALGSLLLMRRNRRRAA